MHKPLRHPGAPWSATSPILAPPTEVDVSSTVLALRTLGTFNFDGNPLLQFVRRCADHFLTSEQAEVRLEAVRTCSRLLRLALNQPGPTVTNTVSAVLGKLLVVGITDTDPDVRISVLASLDDTFDIHLAQVGMLHNASICQELDFISNQYRIFKKSISSVSPCPRGKYPDRFPRGD